VHGGYFHLFIEGYITIIIANGDERSKSTLYITLSVCGACSGPRKFRCVNKYAKNALLDIDQENKKIQ